MKNDREEMTARMEAKMNGRQEEMKAQMGSLASRIEDNNEKFKVLQGTLVSQKDIHQEKMEDRIRSIRSQLEETIQNLMEDVLSCIDQRRRAFAKNSPRR
jgi:hypothetical protein